MSKKWLVAGICLLVTIPSLLLIHLAGWEFGDFQALAIALTVVGLGWLAVPIQIKQPLEDLLADPRYGDMEKPEDFSDYLALCAMLISCVFAWTWF